MANKTVCRVPSVLGRAVGSGVKFLIEVSDKTAQSTTCISRCIYAYCTVFEMTYSIYTFTSTLEFSTKPRVSCQRLRQYFLTTLLAAYLNISC